MWLSTILGLALTFFKQREFQVQLGMMDSMHSESSRDVGIKSFPQVRTQLTASHVDHENIHCIFRLQIPPLRLDSSTMKIL
jgi:hypothetical protein